MKSNSEALELMRAIIHNKVLLMVILSKLGMQDDEIDKLNTSIANSMEEEVEKIKKGDKDENR